jgi:NAD-dependent dihydropyrimidine dehydrogenase PreA subunit
MKRIYLPVISIFVLIWFLLCALWVMADSNSQQPPDSITIGLLKELYGPVIFDHAMHIEMSECSSCHHHTLGDGPSKVSCQRCHAKAEAMDQIICSSCHMSSWATVEKVGAEAPKQYRYHIDIPRLKGAMHLLCVGCHRSEGGPSGCRDCHNFTPAGRARFKESDATMKNFYDAINKDNDHRMVTRRSQ